MPGRGVVRYAVRPMTRRALVLFVLMALIWGIPYLFIRIAVTGISPAVLVFARTAIGAAILLPLALLHGDVRAVLSRWRWVVAFAAAEIGIPWVLLGSAEERVTSSLAALLIAGVPLVGAVLGVATGSRERIGRRGAAGLLVGLAGVSAIVGVDADAANVGAILEIGVVVVGYAVGPAILARRLDGAPALGVMSLALALCAIVYAPIAAIQRPAALPPADVLASVAILGVVCTALAFVLFGALVAEIGAVRGTVITYVNPAVAAVLGKLHAAMAPGGRIAVLGPNFRYCAREYFDCADHTVILTHVSAAEHLHAAGFDVTTVVPRFLPYSFRGLLPPSPRLTGTYLRTPALWRVLGKQFFLVARK